MSRPPDPKTRIRRHVEADWWCDCDEMKPCAGTMAEATCQSTRRGDDRPVMGGRYLGDWAGTLTASWHPNRRLADGQ